MNHGIAHGGRERGDKRAVGEVGNVAPAEHELAWGNVDVVVPPGGRAGPGKRNRPRVERTRRDALGIGNDVPQDGDVSDGNGGLSLFERYPSPGFLLAADIGDVDGDRDLDVVVSNFESRKFDLFLNDGTGRLTRASTSLLAPDAASCAILHDRDADGDLDLTGIDELADEIILFDNR